jgi:transposase InsO family protein
MEPDPNKVQLVQDWKCPLETIKEVEKFTGLVNYFRKYIVGYGHIAAPLNALRKKGVPFAWTEQCTKSMNQLKQQLISAPVLAPPDTSADAPSYEVVADASGLGVGAALFQGNKVIAYEGRKYKPAEANYTVGEQELLAVVNALQVWRCYLEGAPKFKVVTDHNPLIWLGTQQSLSRRQSRWSEFMQRFDFEWVYRPGRLNVADPLSRAPSLRDREPVQLHDAQLMPMLSDGLAQQPGTTALTSVSQLPREMLPSTDVRYTSPTSNAAAYFAVALSQTLSQRKARQPIPSILATAFDIGNAYWEPAATLWAATRGGTVYNTDLPTPPPVVPQPESQPISLIGEKYPHAPPLWDGASGSTDTANEAHGPVPMEVDPAEPIHESNQPDDPSDDPVDMLKQIHAEAELFQQLDSFLDEILQGYKVDPWFESLAHTRSLIRDSSGLYWKGHALVIPEYKQLRQQCLELCHNAKWAGHMGRDKTTYLVQSMYYWPNIAAAVREHVQSCLSCQRNKPSLRKPAGLLVPTQIPERRWSSISVDFIIHLPRTVRGNDAITVFIDRLSKRVHYVACQTTLTAEQFADIFVDTVFKQHGLPLEIISDRDSRFLSSFWTEVTRLLGVQRCMSTACHPRTDGLTERANRTLEEAMRSYVAGDQSDWDSHLPLVEFAVNSSHHVAIGTTPFLMDYGQTPLVPNMLPLVSKNPAARKFVGRWEQRVKRAKEAFRNAQHRNKQLFDRKAEAVSYAVGQRILLSTKNLVYQSW